MRGIRNRDVRSKIGAAIGIAVALSRGAALAGDPPVAQGTVEERITVTAGRPEPETEPLSRDDLESARAANLALAFQAIPGVSGVRRSQNGLEPVVRGLGWERVATQVNGLPLHGACPARMDPPATMITTAPVREASVVMGLSSVTLGPGGTGGRLVVSTDFERAPGSAAEITPWARLAWDESRSGYTGGAGLAGGTERFDYATGFEALDQGDYTSPDGTLVPAAQKESGGFATIGFRAGPAQRFTASALIRNTGRTDYPALMMDSDSDRNRIYNLGWRLRPAAGEGRLMEIAVRAGLASAEHAMSNERRASWATMEETSLGTADARSAAVLARWSAGPRTAPRATFAAGADVTGLDRDALRQRLMVMSGMTSFDHLWPEARQDDLGLFAESSFEMTGGVRMRIGLRRDRVASDALAADDPGLGGLTVRQNYVRYYGPGAARTDRNEHLLSGNIVLSGDLGERITLVGGVGLASRAAGVTERFFAFAPAPGGYLVGDPSLDAERKREASFGAEYRGGRVRAAASIFHHDFGDYINSLVLDRVDLNGDGVPDIVRGFENVRAVLDGIEAAAVLRAAHGLSFPLSVAWVRGENRDGDRPLAEIPPFEGNAAARVALPAAIAGWVEAGVRAAARQGRIDEAYGENATPGFAVWHLRARFTAARRTHVEVAIENLLDRTYHDHLTRAAAVAVGGLLAGDEIPAPGRTILVAVRFGD